MSVLVVNADAIPLHLCRSGSPCRTAVCLCRHCGRDVMDLQSVAPLGEGQGCIRRKGTSAAVPKAVRQAVGGGR